MTLAAYFLKSSKISSEDFGLAQSCRACQGDMSCGQQLRRALTDHARWQLRAFQKVCGSL